MGEVPVVGLQLICENGSRKIVFAVIKRKPFQAQPDQCMRASREKIADICNKEWVIEVYLLRDSQFTQYHVYISDDPVLLPVRCVVEMSTVVGTHQSTRYILLKESEGEFKLNPRTRAAYMKLLE